MSCRLDGYAGASAGGAGVNPNAAAATSGGLSLASASGTTIPGEDHWPFLCESELLGCHLCIHCGTLRCYIFADRFWDCTQMPLASAAGAGCLLLPLLQCQSIAAMPINTHM